MRLSGILPWLLPTVAGLALAAPHFTDELFYDESYTLEWSAGSSAFFHYREPNNHVLFGAALGLWRHVLPLRLLPAVLFAGAILLVVASGVRLAGRTGGLLAGLVFATSHVTIEFALQLRGYGPSWVPVAAGWFALLLDRNELRWRRAALYTAAAFIGVGILPTNVVPFAILSGWSVATALACRDRRALAPAALMAFAPAAGFLCYLGIWSQLVRMARTYTSSASVPSVFAEWHAATLLDLWWAWPAAIAGMFLLARESRATSLLWLLCAIVPPAAYALAANVPYTRTLVPLLPLWLGLIGVAAATALGRLASWHAHAPRAAAAIMVIALLGTAVWREATGAGYESRHPEGARPMSVYDNYFHHRFRPSEAALAVARHAGTGPLLILTDDSDHEALRRALCRHGLAGQLLVVNPAMRASGTEDWRVLLVTRGPGHAQLMVDRTELGRRPRLVADTGFFKVYAADEN